MKSDIIVIGKVAHKLEFKINKNLSSTMDNENSDGFNNVGDLKRMIGGIASNIVYGLTVLGSNPILISQVGRYFDCYYKSYFDKLGVHLKLFYDKEKETASLYYLTDESNQLTVLKQDNSYTYFAEHSLKEILSLSNRNEYSVAFVGTGKVEADVKFLSELNEMKKNLVIIYSPDNNLSEITQWRFSQILNKISVMICEESELKILEEKLKENRNEILAKHSRLKYIISLEHRDRIIIYSQEMKMKVSEGPTDDPESDLSAPWRDAFKAGIIQGISNKKPIDETAKLAASLASYSVEERGDHHYSPSVEQVQLRAFEVKISSKNQ
jgi:adenosine kinase